MGGFGAFFDLGMGVGAPLAGAIAALGGYGLAFGVAAAAAAARRRGGRDRRAGGAQSTCANPTATATARAPETALPLASVPLTSSR